MDTMEVYHAGTEKVNAPNCSAGRSNLDFGQGFYVTDIYDQAYNFALSKSRERKMPPLINSYLLHKADLLGHARYQIFEKYDEKWLEFIVACRSGQDIWKHYDYIEGGVADDRVLNTVNMYMQGFIPEDEALRRLKYLKPNNQICILNQDLLNAHLEFIDCIKLPKDGLL